MDVLGSLDAKPRRLNAGAAEYIAAGPALEQRTTRALNHAGSKSSDVPDVRSRRDDLVELDVRVRPHYLGRRHVGVVDAQGLHPFGGQAIELESWFCSAGDQRSCIPHRADRFLLQRR